MTEATHFSQCVHDQQRRLELRTATASMCPINFRWEETYTPTMHSASLTLAHNALHSPSYLDFIGSVELVDFFSVIFGRRFVGEKRCPKRPIHTPTIHLPVAVDLEWASRDDIEGMIVPYIIVLYGSYTLDIDSDNVGSCIFVQDRALGGEAKYGRPFEN